MKKEIHPKYETTKVNCSCGNSFEVDSTTKDIQVEICSACHPYFTGKEKLIDAAGRVDKFRARQEAAEKFRAEKTKKTAKES